MRCTEVTPYLPGYAGGDLRPDTTRIVAEHVAGCDECRARVATFERVRGGLATVGAREVSPPPYLLDAVIEAVHERRGRRLIPVPPPLPHELVRVVQENREALTQAAGAALVAAGAAYALWRAVRRTRRTAPAIS